MKKILILGAGFLQAFVIRRARELGYYTLALDLYPDAVGFPYAHESAPISIVDAQACLEYAKEKQIDGVLTAATDYGVLAASYIAKEMGLPGLDYSAARRVKNKYEVRRCLYEAGADDTGLSVLVGCEADIPAAEQRVRFPVMVKPCDGSGSRGAARVESGDGFAAACRQAMAQSLTGQATVEPFIEGREYGVESFVEKGNIHVLAVMAKHMTKPPYYAELGHALPSDLSPETEDKIRRCAQRAIRALGINHGSVNMDLLLTDAGTVHIVDIGARMGGNLIGSHLVPLYTGIDYMGNMLRAAVSDPCDFTPRHKGESVATRLLALTPGTVKALPDFSVLSDVQVHHHLAVGDAINEYHTNLDGCGYVVATGPDAQARAEAARLWIDQNIVREV